MDHALTTDHHPTDHASPTGLNPRPKLAGVIPAFNAAAVVSEAITSLLRQTVSLDDIIVVDDGSTDDTAAIADRTGVRVIRQANGGPAAARNTAIRATDAEWIFLLDADDMAYPDRVAIQLEHLHDPEVAVVCGNAPKGSATDITCELLWQRNQITTSTVALRRSAWEAAGGFNESRALIGVEDYNLWLRLTRSGWKVLRLVQPLARYTETETSLTRQVDRFVTAELENVKVLAAEFGLSRGEVHAKEHTVLLQYGLDMFHDRKLAAARRFLSEASRLGALSWPNNVRLWLSHFPALARLLP